MGFWWPARPGKPVKNSGDGSRDWLGNFFNIALVALPVLSKRP